MDGVFGYGEVEVVGDQDESVVCVSSVCGLDVFDDGMGVVFIVVGCDGERRGGEGVCEVDEF